jgi:hypothetical protein
MVYAVDQNITILSLLFVKLALFINGGVLVLLVLGNEIIRVGIGFGELHF